MNPILCISVLYHPNSNIHGGFYAQKKKGLQILKKIKKCVFGKNRSESSRLPQSKSGVSTTLGPARRRSSDRLFGTNSQILTRNF